MNVNIVTALVKSSDGVEFAVLTDAKAIPFEQAFAAKFTAEQLAQHADFLRVADARSLTETFTPAPSPQDETPEERCTGCGTRVASNMHDVDCAVALGAGTQEQLDAEQSAEICDANHEALCRAQARWHTAAVITGDKS